MFNKKCTRIILHHIESDRHSQLLPSVALPEVTFY